MTALVDVAQSWTSMTRDVAPVPGESLWARPLRSLLPCLGICQQQDHECTMHHVLIE